jgi:hypothetical protein
MKHEIPIDKPIRPDREYVYGLTRAVFIMRFAVISLFIICILLIGITFLSLNKPRLVTVVDIGTGKSISALSSNNISDQVIEQQLVYYSRVFCESYLCQDHVILSDARKTAVGLMHPDLARKLPKDWLNDNDVKNCIENQETSYFDWALKPAVTMKNDPRYSVFCQFTKETRREGFEPIKKRYNIRLDWGRLIKNTDPFNRPHSLVLLNFEQLQDESKINEQLQLIK